MADQIICVRIAQRVLNATGTPYTYFPFDRVYLLPVRLSHKVRHLFRYYLSMQLDQDLLVALNALCTDNRGKNTFVKVIKDPSKWLMIVPTHVSSLYRDAKDHKNPYASVLRYVFSKAGMKGHNSFIRLPRMTLHTPSRDIAVFCAMCRHLAYFHAGECTPGQPSCRKRLYVKLKLDNHVNDNVAKSIAETGGTE